MKRHPKKRTLLYNCDCNDYFGMIDELNPTADEYASVCLDALEHTQVDTFLMNLGIGNLALHSSSVLGQYGETTGYHFQDPTFARNYSNALRFERQGIDIQDVLIEGCRRRGLDIFASLRCNDVHDLWPQCVDILPLFKKEHPEWCHPVGVHEQFGNGQPCATALDWTRREVRDLKLAVIREMMEQHDYDGLELDFMRDNVYFVPGDGLGEAFHMTDFIRQVRRFLDDLSESRGKYLELAIRVPMLYEHAVCSGFDIPVIGRDVLCDIITGGTGGNDGLSMDARRYHEALEGSGIRYFGCLNGFYDCADMHNNELATPVRKMEAVAEQLWAQGVDGLSTFNLYPVPTRREGLLHTIGSPHTLAGREKTYTVEKAKNRFGKHLPLVIGETVTDGAEFCIQICEDFTRRDKAPILTLRIFFQNGSLEDVLEYRFNGHPLPEKTLIRRSFGLRDFWYAFSIPVEWIGLENRIEIRLEKRNELLRKLSPLILTEIELCVDYPKEV